MPIYLFRCPGCKYEKEAHLTFEDNLKKACPDCGMDMKVVPQLTPIIFKGRDWTKSTPPKPEPPTSTG